MSIVEHVTWFQSLIGGALIGFSASFLFLTNGKIAGISGIAGGFLKAKPDDRFWRITFLLGLVSGGFVIARFMPENTIDASLPSLNRTIIAAAFVGIGTALGSGCTSGHGVCGLSRFSKRSFIATGTFMLFGFLTVLIGGL